MLSAASPPLGRDDLALQRAFVERVIGRPLRPAEQVIDVLKLDAALNEAKDDLTRAIQVQQRRMARRSLATRRPVRLTATRSMLEPLERLFRLGREEALAELRRAGVQTVEPRRQFANDPHRHAQPHKKLWHGGALEVLAGKLESGLGRISRRVQEGVEAGSVQIDLGEQTQLAVARALLKVPGGRDLASQLVSVALDRGMALTFDANQAAVASWEQTAVLDGATCDPCEEADGTEFASWSDAQDQMPDGGPYVECDGGDRCRCRLVPTGPS